MKKILFISSKTTQLPLLLFNVLNLFKRVLEFNVMATVKLPSLNIYLDPQSVVEIHKLRQIHQTHNKVFQWNGIREMSFEFVYIDICFGTQSPCSTMLFPRWTWFFFSLYLRGQNLQQCCSGEARTRGKKWRPQSISRELKKKQSQISHQSSEPRMRTL